LHKFYKERRSPRGCFECGDTSHFITDCHKRKKFDSSNKYDYVNHNDSSNKDDNKKKNRFRDKKKKKKKKFQQIMSRVCAALSNFDFSSEDYSSSEKDEKIKCKKADFTGLCLMGKSSRNDTDSNVSDDLSFEGLSSKVVELKNALCNKISYFIKFFMRTKILILSWKTLLQKLLLFDRCTMICMLNHVKIAILSL
jgi:hypothetical protein